MSHPARAPSQSRPHRPTRLRQSGLANGALRPARRRADVELARGVFPSDAEMAAAFGVDRSNIARWRAGAPVSPEHRTMLHNLATAIAMLLEFLSPTTVPKWLRGINAHLSDRQPLAVLLHGRLSEVVAAIERERTGAFA
jgi:hypothetical protein